VEIWNVGKQDVFVAQNIAGIYFNAGMRMYLEVGGHLQGSQIGVAADAMPESNPEVTKTFVTNWLTLRKDHYYGTYVYMDPEEFPQLHKPGHYRVKGEYISGGFLRTLLGMLLASTSRTLKSYPSNRGVEQQILIS
jgi:hypothetical protein